MSEAPFTPIWLESRAEGDTVTVHICLGDRDEFRYDHRLKLLEMTIDGLERDPEPRRLFADIMAACGAYQERVVALCVGEKGWTSKVCEPKQADA